MSSSDMRVDAVRYNGVDNNNSVRYVKNKNGFKKIHSIHNTGEYIAYMPSCGIGNLLNGKGNQNTNAASYT